MAVYHLSCGLVLFRKEQDQYHFLLLQYLGGHWDFVKGHVEEGETLEVTAARELEEETGIGHVMVFPNFKEKINYTYYHERQKQNKDVVFLLGETDEKDIVLSDEHQDYIWLPFDKADEHLTFENAQRVLQAAGRYLGIA